MSTVLSFLSRGRWRSITAGKGSSVVSWCCKMGGRCGWKDVSIALPQPRASRIHRDLTASARADDNLPMALNRETSTPKTSCWHKHPDSLYRHQCGPPAPPRSRGSCSAVVLSAWSTWMGCVPEESHPIHMPMDWKLIACSPLAFWGTALCWPVLQTSVSLDEPGNFFTIQGGKLHFLQ